MVLLSKLKKQINQFVTPEIEVIPDAEINFYPRQNDEKNSIVQNSTTVDKKNVTINHENVYSHGLESIYAIETIDLKTIKPLNIINESAPSTKKKYTHPLLDPEFPFGSEFNQTISSFILNESVQALDLSKPCLQILTDFNLFYIRDVTKIDFNDLEIHSNFKKISSEIQPKLDAYLKEKQIYECVTIDFEAWIKSLISENHIKHYFLLKHYDLTHLISVTPIMSVEIKRTKENDYLKYINDSKEELKTIDRQGLNNLNKEIITKSFLKPWIHGRHGIVKEYELLDYLEQLAENTHNFHSCIRLLSDIYEENNFIFKNNLITIYPELYCINESVYKNYKKIEGILKSYFPKSKETYLMNELIVFVIKELLIHWDSVEEEFVRKVIKTSPFFKINRNKNFEIEVTYFTHQKQSM